MVESDSSQTEKGYWQKPENWVSFLTLLAVLTYTGIQIWQTWLIRENNIISQRAFITVGTPQLIMAIDASDRVTKNVVFATPLINSGNTPTKQLEVFVKCAPAFEDLREPWGLMEQGTIERLPQLIGPHRDAPVRCAFTLAHIEQIKAHKAHGYLMVEVSYRDSLDSTTPRKTQFSAEVVDLNIVDQPTISDGASVKDAPPRVMISLTPRGKHNCADEDCPK